MKSEHRPKALVRINRIAGQVAETLSRVVK